MKFVSEIFKGLKYDNFFESNSSIQLKFPNSEHESLINGLLMSEGEYKKFILSFMALEERLVEDSTLFTSIGCAVRHLTHKMSKGELGHRSYLYLCYVLLCAVYDSNSIDYFIYEINRDSKATLDILFNRKLSVQSTCKKMINKMGVDKNSFSDSFDMLNILSSNVKLIYSLMCP